MAAPGHQQDNQSDSALLGRALCHVLKDTTHALAGGDLFLIFATRPAINGGGNCVI